MGGTKALWLKPEYANANYNGAENFICKYRKISSENAELVITEKSFDYQIIHRIIADIKSNSLVDYAFLIWAAQSRHLRAYPAS
jgi:hypothetical protein